MGFFKPITARRLYEMLDEVVKKHQDNEDTLNLDAPIYVCIPDDDDDEGDYRKVLSMGGGEFTDGLVLQLFDVYGD